MFFFGVLLVSAFFLVVMSSGLLPICGIYRHFSVYFQWRYLQPVYWVAAVLQRWWYSSPHHHHALVMSPVLAASHLFRKHDMSAVWTEFKMCSFLRYKVWHAFSFAQRWMLLLKVSTTKLKKFEKEYIAMKEQQEDPLERLQVCSSFSVAFMCNVLQRVSSLLAQ